MGITPRELLREKGTPYAELGLADPNWTDDAAARRHARAPDPDQPADRGHALGTRLCRPSEVVLDILPLPQKGPFTKEDGELLIDAGGRRVG